MSTKKKIEKELEKLELENLSAKEEKWYDLNIPKLPVGITTILFEYSIKFDNSLCRKGITLGHDQFIIETESKNIDSVNKLIEISNNEEKFCIEEKVNTIKITSLNFNFVYNKNTSYSTKMHKNENDNRCLIDKML